MSSVLSKGSSFFRVPKVLIEYIKAHKLTPEAVLLYCLMLDRSSLSERNGDKWKDEKGNFFIFCKLADVKRWMNCGHDKATKLVKQLEAARLITRTSQGPGKTYRIVVHPVADFTHKPASEKSTPPFGFSAGNNTDLSQTYCINTDSSSLLTKDDIAQQIRENIAYHALMEQWPKQDIDNIISLMVDILHPPTPTITVSGVRRSYQSVFDRLMGIGQMDFAYVLDRLKTDAIQVKSMRGYILTLLYEAPAVSDFYYNTRWSFDEEGRRS